jgi:lantibiotic transport system permease protein
MNVFARAVWAESLKLKRTLALWMVVIAPTSIVGLYMGVIWEKADTLSKTGHSWQAIIQSDTVMWAILMLPLFITLETALLANMEHGQKQWKHLFALPVPRWTIYGAKLLVAVFLVFLSSLVFCFELAACGLLMRLLRPGLGFEEAVPWVDIFRLPMLAFLLSLLIITIHTWVSLRWNSFTVAAGFGILAVTITVVIANSDTWGPIYPWALTLNAVGETTPKLAQGLIESIGGAIVVTLLGCWTYIRRDVMD